MPDEIQPGPPPTPDDQHLREPPPGLPAEPAPPVRPDAVTPHLPPAPEPPARRYGEYDFRKPQSLFSGPGLAQAALILFLGFLALGILLFAVCAMA